MPLDPSIPLGVRPPSFNIGEMFGAMNQVQQMRAQGLQLRHAERAEEDDNAINAALRSSVTAEGAPDYNLAARSLELAGHGQAAQKIRTFMDQRAKAQNEAAEVALKNEGLRYGNMETRLGLAHGLLSGVKSSPESYPAVKGKIAELLGPELGGKLPAQYDAAAVDSALTWGANTKAGLATRKQVIDEIASDGLKAKNEREGGEYWTNKLGRWLQTTGNDVEDRQKALAMAREWKVPESVIAQFGDPTAPDFQERVKTVLISPEKRAELTEQERHNRTTEGLTKSGQQEQGRHNRVAERLTAEQIGLTRKALTAKDLDPEQMGPVADMILRDPDQLKNFTATERGKIMKFIATDRGGATPNRRAESLLEIADMAETTLTDLKSHPGLSDAVGYKGPLAAFFGPIAGTAAAGFVSKFDTLKSRLTLPRLEMMRGLGAMSEKEFKALSDAATSLNRDMTEREFSEEIGVIEKTLGAVKGRLRSQINTGGAGVGGLTVAPGGGVPGAGGAQTLLDPAGVPRLVPADKVDEFLRRGGRRP